MAQIVHQFDAPDRFVAGTVGEPGSRAFFLQAREGNRLVTVAVEKQQVAALAERTGSLLDEVESGADTALPAVTPEPMVDMDALDTPIEEEFRAGTITLSWEADVEQIVIEVYSLDDDAVESGVEDEDNAREVLIVRMAGSLARAFAERSAKVIEAGRPECPFCSQPIEPEGHLCVRANGFKRRDG